MSGERYVGILLGTGDHSARQLLKGAAQYVHALTDWRIEHRSAEQPGAFEELRGFDPHGLIVGSVDPETIRHIRGLAIPVVAVGDVLPGTFAHSVQPDYPQVGRMAMTTLTDRAFHRFGFCGTRSHRPSDELLQAVNDVIAAHQFTISSLMLDPEQSLYGHVTAQGNRLEYWLRQLETPVGVVCVSDRLGHAVCEACQQVNLHVPDDVAVIGVGNDEVTCEMSNPPLSSVDIAAERIGFAAAKMLNEQLDGGSPEPSTVRIPPVGVVMRRSSDEFAVDDPTVRDALRYINDHATKGINVPDVVDHLGVSRRWLELCFSRTIGRAPATQIRLTQLEHAKRLLAGTDLMMPDVARAAGLRDPKLLIAVMRRHVGMTPTAYRRKSRQPVP